MRTQHYRHLVGLALLGIMTWFSPSTRDKGPGCPPQTSSVLSGLASFLRGSILPVSRLEYSQAVWRGEAGWDEFGMDVMKSRLPAMPFYTLAVTQMLRRDFPSHGVFL